MQLCFDITFLQFRHKSSTKDLDFCNMFDFIKTCFVCVMFLCCFSLVRLVIIPDSSLHKNWWMVDNPECGLSVSMDRIIGGKNASLGQYPWLARIGYVIPDSDMKANFRCGGTLINPMYVVTAAHCVTNLPGRFVLALIRLGENNAETVIDCDEELCAAPVQDFVPVKVVIHKNYGSPPYKNDIALIRLHAPAFINAWVRPICMPHGELLSRNYVNAMSEVAGWGVYDIDNPKPSNNLLFVHLPVCPLQKCIDSFHKYATLDYRQMCVGGIAGEDSCGGDSGGPLMRVDSYNGPPRYYILGIVSFGAKRCGGSNMPAVYTRIAAYVNWILSNIEP